MRLKRALVEAPVVQFYNQHRETELHTDASKWGYGAMMLPKLPDDQLLRPIYYMSRKTTPAEQNYSSYELEFLAVVKSLDKFRHYLQGLQLKIVTDCTAFKMTINKRELAPRVGRRVMFVEQFDYIIEHRAGERMKHVDFLSRMASICSARDALLNRLARAQDRDEKISAIKTLLRNGDYKDYSMKHGLVYKGEEGLQKLIVPKGLQQELIRRAHEIGHSGVKKTAETLSREYWMSKMNERIEKCIENCLHCILGARKQGKAEGHLTPIPKDHTPFHTLHMDHVGPLPSTSKQYKHLLVIVDAFTKYTWIFATKSTGTAETLQKVRVLQQHFRNPKRIVTDHGTAFTSRDFNEFRQAEGVHI